MNELNIGRAIASKRKARGITQEELAKHMGVSKASVSKWETGHSYPDITFLPKLAAYFNISIDDLIGYEPQMTKEDISRTYSRLSNDFVKKPFEDVLSECRGIVRKYYACFPLLLKMGNLILYYSDLAKEPDKIRALIMEAKELFVRVKNESSNVEAIKKAQYMEAYCCIESGDSKSALQLLEVINEPQMNTGAGLSIAFQMEGRFDEAKVTLQSGIYEHLFHLFYLVQIYTFYSTDDADHYEQTMSRAFSLAETFNVKQIFPSAMMSLYFMAAWGYLNLGDAENSINMLKKFSELVAEDDYPLKTCGDDFFTLIDDWIDDAELGVEIIKNENTYKQRLIDSILNNIQSSSLSGDSRFRSLKKRLSEIKDKLDKKSKK